MTDRPPRLFPLAPMSGALRVLTGLLLLLAPTFVVLGVVRLAPGLGWVGGLLGALYALVWLAARPAGFAVQPASLWIVFPLWRRAISWESVVRARPLGPVRDDLGFPIRVGVGGLWGIFGWLWTSRRGWVEVYASRTDGLVLVERRDAKPLLLSPTDPEAFVAEVTARAPAP